jgi:MotA/TolQ/ExbB proton channel family protein
MASTPQSAPATRSLQTAAAFLIGIPLAAGILAGIRLTPLRDSEIARYVGHPVEMVEVVLICCALAALLLKLLGGLVERAAARVELLPPWDGQPVPVGEALALRQGLIHSAHRWRATTRFRRVMAVLDFLISRRSAAELDDQLRALADTDALSLENSYSLVRLITWATPILGFLGTVLGITQSVANVNPEALDLSSVTGGLALAFDATALALGLTMMIMFISYVVDRLETSALEAVDRYVDEQLAHRFERLDSSSGEFVAALRQNTDVLLQATESLVVKQAQVWSRTVETMERRWAEAQQRQAEQLTAALENALERTLATHAQRLATLEKQVLSGCAEMLEGMTGLAGALRDSGREQQRTLVELFERVTAQTEALAGLQEGEAHLARLQQTLGQNLSALTAGGAFEEAVHSLTAAIHLLTARTQHRPGAAA